MTDQAVDSASRHTERSAKALADAGITCALRYRYNTDLGEVEVLHKNGVAFGAIYERMGNAAVVNPAAGTAHGHDAMTFFQSIGLPRGCAIYFAEADTYVAQSQFGKARDYWARAAAEVRPAGYRCGAYGGSVLIDYLMAEGVVDLTWQTGADSWSEYVESQTACLRQLLGYRDFGGVQTDVNNILKEDCGFWTPTGAQQAAHQTAVIVADTITNLTEDLSMYPINVDGHQYVIPPSGPNDIYGITDAGRVTLLEAGVVQRYKGEGATNKVDGDDWREVSDPTLNTLRPIIARKIKDGTLVVVGDPGPAGAPIL